MAMVAFHEYFPELAQKEVRSAILKDEGELPEDEYMFVESYCDEPDCDCRRVLLNVMSRKRQKFEAVISYGFDRNGDMPGPFLDPINPLGEYAEAVLGLSKFVLSDLRYVARLERHYQMFKAACKGPRIEKKWWKRKRKKPKR